MKRALSIIETIVNEYPDEISRIIRDYETKTFVDFIDGEIVVDKDFMKIFSVISYTHFDNPSNYLINKDDCVDIVKPAIEFLPISISNYIADIENGDSNMLRKTCTFIFALRQFCQFEHRKPVEVLNYVHDNPAEKERNIKTRLKAFFKLQKHDYDLKTSNFNVGIISVLSNKRIQDILTDIYNHY